MFSRTCGHDLVQRRLIHTSASVQIVQKRNPNPWIPAFAGMTMQAIVSFACDLKHFQISYQRCKKKREAFRLLEGFGRGCGRVVCLGRSLTAFGMTVVARAVTFRSQVVVLIPMPFRLFQL